MRKLGVLLVLACCWVTNGHAQSPRPTAGTQPITNGKLKTDLDASGHKILNLDTSNLPTGGATLPSTSNLIKGNGSGGAAVATPGTDYVSPSGTLNLNVFSSILGTLPIARLPIGTTSTTVAAGNDARFPTLDGSGNILLKNTLFVDPSDPTKIVQFLTGGIPTGTTLHATPPTQDFTWGIVPLPPVPDQFITSFNSDGTPNTAPPHPFQFVYDIAVLGDANATILNDGTISRIVLASTLTAPRSFDFPDSHSYNDGAEITYYGAVGGVSPTTPITFSSPYGDTFSGAPSVTITQPYARVVFTLNLATHNWTYSGVSGGADTDMPFADISGSTIPVGYTPGAKRENNTATLTADSAITFNSSIPDGRTGNLIVTQDGTGGHALTWPGNSYTGASGAGVLNISQAANAQTWIEWLKRGATYYIRATTDMTAAAAATGTTALTDAFGNTVSGLTSSTGGTATSIKLGNTTSVYYQSGSFIAPSSHTITRIDLPLAKVGVPTGWNVGVYIYTDATRATATDLNTTNGSSTVSSTTITFATSDLGQHITGTNIPANSYVGTIVDAHTITLSSTRPGPGVTFPLAAAATGTTTTGSVSLYGLPGTVVGTGTTSGMGLDVSTIASGIYTFAAGVSAPIVAGTIYQVVLVGGFSTADTSNYITWSARNGQVITSHKGTLSAVWSAVSNGTTPSFTLYY